MLNCLFNSNSNWIQSCLIQNHMQIAVHKHSMLNYTFNSNSIFATLLNSFQSNIFMLNFHLNMTHNTLWNFQNLIIFKDANICGNMIFSRMSGMMYISVHVREPLGFWNWCRWTHKVQYMWNNVFQQRIKGKIIHRWNNSLKYYLWLLFFNNLLHLLYEPWDVWINI